MSLISMLESSCFILRPSSITRDTAGGVVQVFTMLSAFLPCSQQMAGPAIQTLYNQRNADVSTTIYFADDPGATANDYLIAIDDLTQTSTQYLAMGRALAVPRFQCPWLLQCQYVQAPDGPAQVIRPTVLDITQTTADVEATISSDGDSPITLRGFVYSKTTLNPYPVLGGTSVSDFPVAGTTGVMTATLPGLTSATSYSFRPYVQNGVAITYGEIVTFTTDT